MQRVFWGDIHIHSGFDDGRGNPGDIYRFCRDVMRFDFAAVTNHDWGQNMTDSGWTKMKAISNSHYEPGRFVTLHGYEWTNWVEGHRNVYFPGDDPPIFRYRVGDPRTAEAGSRLDERYSTHRGLIEAVKKAGAIAIPHHPLACMNDCIDEEAEPVVEIYSTWGSSELRGSPLWNAIKMAPRDPAKRADAITATEVLYGDRGRSVQELLDAGLRFGIVCGSDNHGGRPGSGYYRSMGTNLNFKGGLMAVLAEDLTREALFEAIRQRRTYGTTGERILLEFTVNGAAMGSVIRLTDLAEPRQVVARAIGTSRIASIDVVKNGEVCFTWHGALDDESFSFTDDGQVIPNSKDYYYLRVLQDNGERAWSSPIWIAPVDDGVSLATTS